MGERTIFERSIVIVSLTSYNRMAIRLADVVVYISGIKDMYGNEGG